MAIRCQVVGIKLYNFRYCISKQSSKASKGWKEIERCSPLWLPFFKGFYQSEFQSGDAWRLECRGCWFHPPHAHCPKESSSFLLRWGQPVTAYSNLSLRHKKRHFFFSIKKKHLFKVMNWAFMLSLPIRLSVTLAIAEQGT